MKRFFSGLMALMLLTFCVGCGGGSTHQESGAAPQEPEHVPSGLYYDLTGIDPKEILMTVDGNKIPAELYLYWSCYATSNLEYQMNMLYNYYGVYGELFHEDGTLNWSANFTDSVTLSQFARQQTDSLATSYAVLENLAREHGVTLTEEDRAAIAANRAAAVESLGGEEAFREHLAQLGITPEIFDHTSSYDYLLKHLTQLVMDESSPLYLEMTDYDRYATFADHILLSTRDTATQTPLSEEEAAAKRATAEELLAQLQAVEGEELLALFTQLADQHSEDPGHATNPKGYIYTPGSMVSAFEEAASALEPGQISGIVESEYGYHIILRRDLAQGLAQDPVQREELASAHLQSRLQELAQNAQVTFSETLTDFDTGAFYQDYLAATSQLTQESGDTAEGSAAEGQP